MSNCDRLRILEEGVLNIRKSGGNPGRVIASKNCIAVTLVEAIEELLSCARESRVDQAFVLADPIGARDKILDLLPVVFIEAHGVDEADGIVGCINIVLEGPISED